jgi:hypothetical protein
MRYGSVSRKASKLDPIYQTFSVRDNEGFIELYHKDLAKWVECPANWIKDIVWETKVPA